MTAAFALVTHLGAMDRNLALRRVPGHTRNAPRRSQSLKFGRVKTLLRPCISSHCRILRSALGYLYPEAGAR